MQQRDTSSQHQKRISPSQVLQEQITRNIHDTSKGI
jgi:hypothetical protein